MAVVALEAGQSELHRHTGDPTQNLVLLAFEKTLQNLLTCTNLLTFWLENQCVFSCNVLLLTSCLLLYGNCINKKPSCKPAIWNFKDVLERTPDYRFKERIREGCPSIKIGAPALTKSWLRALPDSSVTWSVVERGWNDRLCTFIYICDLARVCCSATSHVVHAHLFLGLHPCVWLQRMCLA